MQFQADILGIDVERPTRIETTGLGAGYLAGLTVGVWSGIHELESHRKVDTVFSPKISNNQRQENLTVGKMLSEGS